MKYLPKKMNTHQIPSHSIILILILGLNLIRTLFLADVQPYFIIISCGYIISLYYIFKQNSVGFILALSTALFDGIIAIIFSQFIDLVRCILSVLIIIADFRIILSRLSLTLFTRTQYHNM